MLDNFFAISQLFFFGDMVDFFVKWVTNVKIIGVITKIAFISIFYLFVCLCVYICMYICMFCSFSFFIIIIQETTAPYILLFFSI